MYLHVITYNKGAIRMYERLGFMRVKKIEGTKATMKMNRMLFLFRIVLVLFDLYHFRIQLVLPLHSNLHSNIDYYTINSVNYACYLYARYFHGKSVCGGDDDDDDAIAEMMRFLNFFFVIFI